MNYKYQVGQEIPVGGIITITGLAHNKNGNPVYDTDRGVVVPELLFERLEMKPLEKVQPEQPKQADEPKFKVGDMVKCLGKYHAEYEAFYPALGTIGKIVSTDGDERQTYKIKWASGSTSLSGTWWAYNDDIEPYSEPKQEPVKLYCVGNYKPGVYLTKGKVYEYVPGRGFPYDNYPGCPEKDYVTWARFNPVISACLVPLVSRPAEAGEWVYVTHTDYPDDLKVGDIAKVKLVDAAGSVYISKPDSCHQSGLNYGINEYLVLDGYKPEPEKAEPEYYSGKVVCVESNDDSFTAGKVYEFKGGYLTDDQGKIRPSITANERITSLSDEYMKH